MASRDRLAALRAQQQGGNGNNSPSRETNNPYAQFDTNYEMNDVQSTTHLTAGLSGGFNESMAEFYDEISSIQDGLKQFNENVSRISELHSRSINTADETAGQRNAAELEEIVEDTGALSNTLKRRIKALEREGGSGRDGQIKKQQTGLVKTKFLEAIQNYQTVEQQHRQKYKQRIERQYKIVKPDATPEEVRTVVDDDNGGQVFSQALMNTNRYGESKAAYREVQERHRDIQKIERTLTELAQLFNDMSILVEQQDETVDVIQDAAASVEKDAEAGTGHTTKAVSSARAARKKRWICFGLFVILLIIVAIIIAVVVLNNKKKE
jgi:syntaxin 1B/2/3